jgi:outer membrane murein-binding lipoprotein Lpp
VDISWPVAVIVIFVAIMVGSAAMAYMSGRSSLAIEEAKGRNGEQYRTLAATYEQLAKEMRDSTSAMQADLAAMRERVDSIDKMMREVS